MVKVHSITQEGENILVIADMPNESEHLVIIPVAAIGDRMVMYGLDDPDEALNAILHEHYVRLHPEIDTPTSREDLIGSFQNDAVGVNGAANDRKLVLENNIDSINDVAAERAVGQ